LLLIFREPVAALGTLRPVISKCTMSEAKVISVIVLISVGLWFSIREWRRWLKLKEPKVLRNRAIIYTVVTGYVAVGWILAELGSQWHWAKVISHNFEWVMIGTLLLWLLVSDWSTWMALKEPDPKVRNRAILNTVVTVTLGVLVYCTEFC
jgi:hypothetical protein